MGALAWYNEVRLGVGGSMVRANDVILKHLKKLFYLHLGVAITSDYAILFPVMRDKNMKEKTVKVKGPWVDGVQTVKEISQEEWTSYTPLNRRVKNEWFRVVKW